MSEQQLPTGSAETDIAVVGLAGRFPGAPDVATFWNNLRDGVESVTRLTDEELRAAGVSDELLADPDYVRASFQMPDMAGFDAGFFGFAPREAAIMDPQQRHFLELAWTAMEHAGHAPERFGGSVGVFAGCGASVYMMFNLLTNPELVENVGFFLLRHTGNDKDFLATRASYLMNLRGPSVNVQTACSTSLVAVHLAVQSLLNNECDMALAGGTTVKQPHPVGYLYKEGEIMAPDGHCRAFDAKAEGTVFGSGAGVVVLRRLADAIRDGDTIHAVIKGSAINNDGAQKVGFLAPSVDGQAQAVAEALALADVDPESIQYVECHGTATPVGDPIEIAALTQAYQGAGAERTGYCAIASLKSNVGHLDTAAGVASVIKTVEALKHRQIPPSLHYTEANPSIDFASSPFFVNDKLREWTTDGGPRRAGISSLGAGGTNAHVIMEEAPALQPSGPSREHQLYVLSAKTPTALDTATANLAASLRTAENAPADVAFTLANGRQALAHRRVVVAASASEAADLLERNDPKVVPTAQVSDRKRALAFMFAGGGAQYAGMGADLYEREPVYRAAVDECVALLQPELDWDLKSLLLAAPADRDRLGEELERPSRSLPCLFITQYAMAKLCLDWGLEPQAMIGHSMGEYTAAHLAGVFSLADGLALVTLRGKLFERIPAGGMLSVPLSAADLEQRLPAELSIAAINAPELCVASGPLHALDALEKALAADEIDCRRIRINIAAHSAMLEPILKEFGEFFRRITLSPPTRPFVSNVTGDWIKPEEATSPEYWVRHLRHTVRFADGIGVLLRDEGRALLEIGPGRVLATLASLHTERKADQPTLTSMRHPEEAGSDVAHALAMVGRLWLNGVTPNWGSLWKGERRRRIPLPTYPFEHQQYFIQPGKGAAAAKPTLARRNDVGQWFYETTWQRTPLAAKRTLPTGTRWLVFRDEQGLGASLATRLGRDGTVVSVLAGAGFRQVDSTTYTVNPSHPEQMTELVATLAKQGGVPSRIVHTWNAGPANPSDLSNGREFVSLLGLQQAFASEGIEDAIRLDVVTTAMQRVAGESVLEPRRALVLGPVRVIPKEFPNVTTRSIDLSGPGTPGWFEARAVEQLITELAADAGPDAVAWRGTDRWVESYAQTPMQAAEAGPVVRDGAVCLVTGGLGGLGLVIAEDLARAAKVKLVLLSRRGRTPESDPAIRTLEGLGAEVLVVAADVADPGQLRAAVGQARQRFGPVTHLLHAAGVIEDALIPMKDAASAERVFAPKIQGTLALDEALAGEPLERVVVFSSRGAVAGVAGQVDYTAASAFLDAWAERKAVLDGTPVLSIGWSAWQGVGLAAGQAGSAAKGRPTDHPFLDSCVAEGEVTEFRSVLGTETHWLLDGHRIKDAEALIPGTGYLEIIRAAAAEGVQQDPIELHDVYFIAPFMVHGKDRRELRVTVEGARGTERDIVIEGRTPGATEWDEHARAVAAPLSGAAPARQDVAAIQARCSTRRVTFAGHHDREHLVLGKRWDNITQLDYGATEALGVFSMPAEFHAELPIYRIHPALLDVATACAQALIPDFDSKRDFYIPVSYGRIRIWDALPAECLSHIRLQPAAEAGQDTAVYDVTLLAPDGRVLVEINDFTMMKVKDRVKVGHDGADRAGAPALQFQGAMTPDEGLDAFRRLLASGTVGHVIVSPQDLPTYLEALRAPPEPVERAAPPEPEQPAIDVAPIEAVLAAHEAVHQAFVTARRERTGTIRITAFVLFELGEQATISEMRRFLKGKVPDDMIPQHLIEIESVPLGADGKVDRAALPDPFAGADDFIGPRTEMEKTIAGIWKELLGAARISVHDNFLDVGGHSLLAMRAVSRIAKQTGVRLNPSVMTLHTLEQIAAECAEKAGSAAGAGR
ncbi:MAG: type I polyketide synthase [Gemmatimonadales bacterium]